MGANAVAPSSVLTMIVADQPILPVSGATVTSSFDGSRGLAGWAWKAE